MEITGPAKTTAQSWGQGPAHTTNKQTNWGHVASGSRVCERQPTMAGADIWAWASGCQTEVPSNLWEIAVGLSVTQGGENVTSTERRNPKPLPKGILGVNK